MHAKVEACLEIYPQEQQAQCPIRLQPKLHNQISHYSFKSHMLQVFDLGDKQKAFNKIRKYDLSGVF